MHPDPTNATVTAWRALLTLSEVERTQFLAAARAFDAATTRRSVLPLPALAPIHALPATIVARPRTEMLTVAGGARSSARRRSSGAHAAEKLLALSASESKALAHKASLPLVGGAALDLAPRTAFSEASFIDRWRPGTTIGVYCGGNQRLASLIRPLRLHAYAVGSDPGVGKVGTARDIARRMAELGQSVHAGVSKADPTSVDAGPGLERGTAARGDHDPVPRQPRQGGGGRPRMSTAHHPQRQRLRQNAGQGDGQRQPGGLGQQCRGAGALRGEQCRSADTCPRHPWSWRQSGVVDRAGADPPASRCGATGPPLRADHHRPSHDRAALLCCR